MKHLQITDDLYQYLLDKSLREHAVQEELRTYTASMPNAIMQVAPEQAQFMQFLLKLIGAKRVLELGTFTGYSALSMALALPEDGEVITCDVSTEWTDIAVPYWKKAGQNHKIKLIIGEAKKTMQALLDDHTHFDFIFIDADKSNYPDYYEMALNCLNPNGVIAIDNAFFHGDVLEAKPKRKGTQAIQSLNHALKTDNRVEISLLPISDGLFLVRPK